MCTDCGCSEALTPSPPETIEVHYDILDKNNRLAHSNHHWFHDHKITAVNLMSSPGSGKTALLEKTIQSLGNEFKLALLTGDQQTENDSNRLKQAGGKAKQISTPSSCHLDAEMIKNELGTFVQGPLDFLFIENVGNLVCPAAFDLGESVRVALLSTTEGEDKPLKYPLLFHKAHAIVLTKMDLVPYLNWDEELALENIRKVNSKAKIIKIHNQSAEGVSDWTDYLKALFQEKRERFKSPVHQ